MEFWKKYVQGSLLINEVPIVKKLPLRYQKTISKVLIPSSSTYQQHIVTKELKPVSLSLERQKFGSSIMLNNRTVFVYPPSTVLVSSSKSVKKTPYLSKSISSPLSYEKFIELPSTFYQTRNIPLSSASVVSSAEVYLNREPRMVGKTILTPMKKIVSSNGKVRVVRLKQRPSNTAETPRNAIVSDSVEEQTKVVDEAFEYIGNNVGLPGSKLKLGGQSQMSSNVAVHLGSSEKSVSSSILENNGNRLSSSAEVLMPSVVSPGKIFGSSSNTNSSSGNTISTSIV